VGICAPRAPGGGQGVYAGYVSKLFVDQYHGQILSRFGLSNFFISQLIYVLYMDLKTGAGLFLNAGIMHDICST
jgi:hypothetical protein